jgi:hypothetical protein
VTDEKVHDASAELVLALGGTEHRDRARVQDALGPQPRRGALHQARRVQDGRRHVKAAMPSSSRPMMSRWMLAVPSIAGQHRAVAPAALDARVDGEPPRPHALHGDLARANRGLDGEQLGHGDVAGARARPSSRMARALRQSNLAACNRVAASARDIWIPWNRPIGRPNAVRSFA